MDNITPWLLKAAADIIALPLTYNVDKGHLFSFQIRGKGSS